MKPQFKVNQIVILNGTGRAFQVTDVGDTSYGLTELYVADEDESYLSFEYAHLLTLAGFVG